MTHPRRYRRRLSVGATFETSNPMWGRASYTVVQHLPDGASILYRTNVGRLDERNRFYIIGGAGRRGLRLLEDA